MTIEEIIKKELTPRTEILWTKKYKNFVPELFVEIFGNGKSLMYLTPLDTRPYYYLIRVHSNLLKLSDGKVKRFIEDLIIPALIEEYGDRDRLKNDDEVDEDDPILDFPCFDPDGYSYGFFDENGETD